MMTMLPQDWFESKPKPKRPKRRLRPRAGTLESPDSPAARLATRVVYTPQIGELVTDIRKAVGIRQVDLADRVRVGRQWMIALEAGQPSLEIGLVLRTLEVLGLDIELKPYAPPPPWLQRAALDAAARRAAAEARRRVRRRTRRQIDRERRLGANLPTDIMDLE